MTTRWGRMAGTWRGLLPLRLQRQRSCAHSSHRSPRLRRLCSKSSLDSSHLVQTIGWSPNKMARDYIFPSAFSGLAGRPEQGQDISSRLRGLARLADESSLPMVSASAHVYLRASNLYPRPVNKNELQQQQQRQGITNSLGRCGIGYGTDSSQLHLPARTAFGIIAACDSETPQVGRRSMFCHAYPWHDSNKQ